MRRFLPLTLVLLTALPAEAQETPGFFDRLFGTDESSSDEEQGGLLERFIEDNLSGEGREVSIRGFAGALSGRATLDNLTVKDDQGEWLILNDVVLDWSRLALFRGRLEVTELTAAEIMMPRLPVPSETAEPPTPEASGFSLPELPVSVAIDSVAAERVDIGQPVFGIETVVSIGGALNLEGGEGSASLSLDKLDGSGTIALGAGFSNQSRVLNVDLIVKEDEDGILAQLLDLPGRPSVEFEIKGEAPIDNYSADIRLSTDGAERLAGQVTTSIPEGSEPGTLQTIAHVSGDIAPIFYPEYQPFFGPDVRVAASVLSFPDGRLHIEELDLSAASLRLGGIVRLGSDGLPSEIDLTGDIAQDGTPVLLPIPGPETRVNRVDLNVQFDAADSDMWRGAFVIAELDRPGFSTAELSLSGTGRIRSQPEASISASFDFSATELDLGSPEAAEALGEVVTGRADLDWTSGGPLRLEGLSVNGETYGLDGNAEVAFAGNGPAISGEANLFANQLSAFSGIAGRTLGGRVALETDFDLQPLAGFFDFSAKGTSGDLFVDNEQADRILEGEANLDISARRDKTGIAAEIRTLETPNAEITGRISLKSGGSALVLSGSLDDASILLPQVSGPVRLTGDAQEDDDRVWSWNVETALEGTRLIGRGSAVDVFHLPVISGSGRFEADDLSDFAALAERPIAGSISTDFAGELATDLSRVSLKLTGSSSNLKTGIAQADSLLGGDVIFDLDGAVAGNVYTLRDSSAVGPWIELQGNGEIVPETGRFDITGRLPDASKLLVGAPAESLEFSARGQQAGLDWQVVTEARGAGLSIKLDGTAADPLGQAAAFDGKLQANADDLSILADLSGLPLAGKLAGDASGRISADLEHFDLTGSIAGSNLSIGQTEADRLLTGDLSLEFAAVRDGAEIRIASMDLSTALLSANASGSLAADGSEIELRARLQEISSFAPGFAGPATVTGTLGQNPDGQYELDLAASGPGGSEVSASGTAEADLKNVDMDIRGNAPLGFLNSFIAPRAVSGTAGFRLSIRGAPSLNSLSGQITSSGARLIAPTLNVVLNDISATAALSGGRAQISMTAAVESGGVLSANGPVSLTSPFPADLTVALRQVVLKDPRILETTVDGDISISGPLLGGARISGDLALAETNIRIPSSGLGGAGAIPEITHLNEPPPVRGTRQRAGLLGGGTSNSQATGPGYSLDIRVSAPNRLFIRGRGLESEFGGDLRITGTTNNTIPLGAFNLIRGRLDILGQRLALEEATVTIQGSFLPIVRIRATTRAEEYAINVIVAGPVMDPEISFTSEPELPQEEVLARLIFGRGLDTLSPIQAARLALAVRTLAGRGGEGIVGNIRQGAGLADLDITVDEEGNTAVTAGAYLGENLYTDVTIGAGGETKLNLNLDVSPSFTLKGSVTNEGDSSIGVFFERDY
ncbi:translocation/assembly module TamB domain-containing protein [Silicimonas sp. MF1-12-2]|uniref:translocation/assembly module TamB domain-containing protein n=1 Tax=Silicimonas sp. MF1-12-2 TaxID=3384793 RepID=UPI0039B63D07